MSENSYVDTIRIGGQDIPIRDTEARDEVTDLKSAIDKLAQIPGDNNINVANFTDKSTGVTYTVDSENGAITITNKGSANYACVQTPSTFIGSNLTVGHTYRVYAKAQKISGSPNMHIAIRGVDGNVDGIAKQVELNNGEGFVDFVADQYMKRVTLFVSFGSSTINSVAMFSDISVKDYSIGVDEVARDDVANVDLKVNAISGNTENIFFFNNTTSRVLRNEMSVNFPDNSTMEFSTGEQPLSSDLTISSLLGNDVLTAGKTYKYLRRVNYSNGADYGFYRVNAQTGAIIGRILHGAVFTPSVDEKIRIIFRNGATQNASITWYIAELEHANEEIVPNHIATDYIARRMANSSVPQTVVDGITDYSNLVVCGYNIYLANEYADIQNLHPNDQYCCAVVPCDSGDKFKIVAYGQINPRTWGFLNAEYKVLSAASENQTTEDHVVLNPITLTAPDNAKYLVVNSAYVLCGFTPQIIKLSKNETINKVYEDIGVIPKERTWKSKVVAVYKNYVAILDNDKLKFSKDCGNSFNDGVSISGVDGIIKSYHFYNNGCLGFFTNQKAYYIESEWTVYNEAECYESDGQTPFAPAPLENFYTINDYKERKIVNGQDIYVFGNYVVNGAPDTRKLIWASLDNGHSYRIVYEFGAGFEYNVRHVHCVVYYEPDDKYIVATGDAARESYVFTLTYSDGAFTLAHLAGPSLDYKWANVEIYANELFYSYDNTPGRIRKCTYANIDNYSSHTTILDNTPNDAIDMRFGERGDAIVIISYHRSNGIVPGAPPKTVCSRMIYYTPNRKDFYQIYVPPQIANGYTSFSGLLPVTGDGHFICGAHHAGTTNWNKLPSVYLDDWVRLAGFPQAFKTTWSV